MAPKSHRSSIFRWRNGKVVEEPEPEFTEMNGYGRCPHCGAMVMERERRPDGNDTCQEGHVFPSASTLTSLAAKPNAEFEQLMADSATYVAELRADLCKMLPDLKVNKESCEAYIAAIEKTPAVLFGFAPPLPSGGFATVADADVQECAKAVVRILKRRLEKTTKAIGGCDESQ
jgi:hypothetical protein